MSMLKRNVTPLILMVLVWGLLTLLAPRAAGEIECKGVCELALERCLRDGFDHKSSINP